MTTRAQPLPQDHLLKHATLATIYHCLSFLIQLFVIAEEDNGDAPPEGDETTPMNTVTTEGDIRIAAIDNGLAFPFKHPDEWRTCEYMLHLQLFIKPTLLLASFNFFVSHVIK